jgi:phage terminase large subunit-like protein
MAERIPAKFSFVNWIASQPKARRDQAARNLSIEDAEDVEEDLECDWSLQGRDSQRPPPGDWRVWLLLAGRGFGKTRAGAEAVRARAESGEARHIALVAPTAADVRAVMVEGESGLLSVGPPERRPDYEPSNHLLIWPNGAIATTEEYGDAACASPPRGDALSTAIWLGELVGQVATLTSVKTASP